MWPEGHGLDKLVLGSGAFGRRSGRECGALMEGHSEKAAVCNQKRAPPEANRAAPSSWTSSLRNCEKEISVVFKIASPSHFVTAARPD